MYFAVLPINSISADVILDLSSSLIDQFSHPYIKVGINRSSLWRKCLNITSLSRGGKVERTLPPDLPVERLASSHEEILNTCKSQIKQTGRSKTVGTMFLFIIIAQTCFGLISWYLKPNSGIVLFGERLNIDFGHNRLFQYLLNIILYCVN